MRSLGRLFSILLLILTTMLTLTGSGNAAGKIATQEGTSGNFYWLYPSVCSYFNRVVNDGEIYQVTLTVACPGGQGFSAFEIHYGSGNSHGILDNFSRKVDINGLRGEYTTIVKAIPGPDVWVNLKVYPLN